MQAKKRAVVRQYLTSDKTCKFCGDEMGAGWEADFINEPLQIVCTDCGDKFVQKGRGVREKKAPPKTGEAGRDRTASINHESSDSIALREIAASLSKLVEQISFAPPIQQPGLTREEVQAMIFEETANLCDVFEAKLQAALSRNTAPQVQSVAQHRSKWPVEPAGEIPF